MSKPPRNKIYTKADKIIIRLEVDPPINIQVFKVVTKTEVQFTIEAFISYQMQQVCLG